MSNSKLIAPVVKWAGGKRQLLRAFRPLLPKNVAACTYCEPFAGGGALWLDLQPKTAIINDINKELISLYEVVRNSVETLISALEEFKNDREHFYAVRDWDRDREKYENLSAIQKAARIIYLNKTCYNGLFRVNHAGEFNAPFGDYRNPKIVNAPVLREVSAYFNSADITFSALDYADVLRPLPKNTFVYLDPPYDPVSDSSNFTGYSKIGFHREDQIRLRECCDDLSRRGIKFMLSNSATAFIRKQYSAYHIHPVWAKRTINSDSKKRGNVPEVVIRNYK